MMHELVEKYLSDLGPPEDDVLKRVAHEARELGIPAVPLDTGRLLNVLAVSLGARRILEVGTGNGYSTIWLARALAGDGLLLSIEHDAGRASLARRNLAEAGLAERASVMLGEASRLVWKVSGPFDMIFQDADKTLYEPLLDRLVALLRPGGMLVTDNALWYGEVVPGLVAEPRKPAETTRAIAAYNARISADPRLLTVVLPIGDGVALSVRRPGLEP